MWIGLTWCCLAVRRCPRLWARTSFSTLNLVFPLLHDLSGEFRDLFCLMGPQFSDSKPCFAFLWIHTSESKYKAKSEHGYLPLRSLHLLGSLSSRFAESIPFPTRGSSANQTKRIDLEKFVHTSVEVFWSCFTSFLSSAAAVSDMTDEMASNVYYYVTSSAIQSSLNHLNYDHEMVLKHESSLLQISNRAFDCLSRK